MTTLTCHVVQCGATFCFESTQLSATYSFSTTVACHEPAQPHAPKVRNKSSSFEKNLGVCVIVNVSIEPVVPLFLVTPPHKIHCIY